MSLPIKYRLICEGPSEWTYLQRLSAFIVDKLPPMEDGFTPRLSFFPTVTNDKIGGGSFKLVSRAYRKVCPQNKKVPLRIWVDCDIYIRNSNASERANATGYAQKKTMPDFNFMVMNFEDFVAMHFPDEIFEAWKVEMQNAGHFTVPLHGAVYEPHFEKFWQMYLQSVALGDVESYQKGSLPEDFVTVGSLKNMICHCTDSLLLPLFQRHAPIGPFPQFFVSMGSVSMGSDPMENRKPPWKTKGEHESHLGRADAVLELPNGVYLFEFKYAKSSAEALAQIHERGYADAYRDDPRPVWLIGCNCNPETRNLDRPAMERLGA